MSPESCTCGATRSFEFQIMPQLLRKAIFVFTYKNDLLLLKKKAIVIRLSVHYITYESILEQKTYITKERKSLYEDAVDRSITSFILILNHTRKLLKWK